jgi:ABC-type sugar transport system ATPase subunit
LASVRLEDVVVRKGDVTVLEGVDLSVADGEMVVVLGPSGAGKSTLLRAVAGLDAVSSGSVWIGGKDVTNVPTHERDLAMVFQDNALFPFMSVRRNISFPLRINKTPREEIDRRVDAEARVLAIEHLLQRRPGQLSAGHQQLVQAARALVRVPQAFLMDEPLVRLDAQTRSSMRRELRLLQQGYGVTALYVANDPEEAMAVADRIAVIEAGRIVQVGSPMRVYRDPVSRTVARLVGNPPMPIVPGRVVADPPGFWVELGSLRVRAWTPTLAGVAGSAVDVGVRPEDVVADPEGPELSVIAVEHHGSHSLISLDLGGDVHLRMRAGEVPPPMFTKIRVGLLGLQVFERGGGATVGRVERRTPDP